MVASRLDAPKGLLALLDGGERSGLDGRTRLTLIGDGELTAELRDRSARFASVALLGRLNSDDLAEQFDQHAVIVVPSIWEEPFGLTAVEAMASGRPVLATTAGALAELVDDSVGWSVPPTVDGLACGLVMAHGASAQERRQGISRTCPL
ncbi:MAG: glycosyltransferase [Acidimicrobiia bacterium]|nr:glycosyltransferase [Acidimicrobiia bacterium]